MELYQIQCIKKIAESKSMSQAALDLNVSQPSLSRTLKNLEEELGVALFERTGRKLVLNEKGRQFHHYANQILELADRMVIDLSEKSPQATHTLNIAMLHSNHLLPKLITEFTSLNPNIRINLKRFVTMEEISNDCDFIIHASNQVLSPSSRSVLLLEEECMLGMSRNHKLASYEEISPEELVNQPFISMNPANALGALLADSFASMKIVPNIVLQCDSQITVSSLISQNIGIALFPTITWSVESEHIVLKRIREKKIIRTLYLTQVSPVQNKDTFAFRDFAIDFFKVRQLSLALTPDP